MVKRGDHVVRCPNGDVQVMGRSEFSRDFERAQNGNQSLQFPGMLTFASGISTRNNFGIE